MAGSLDLLARALHGLAEGANREAALREVDGWAADEWRAALLDLPSVDRGYEDRFQITRSAEIERLWTWWSTTDAERCPLSPHATGFAACFLLTLVVMQESDRLRFGAADDDSEIVPGLGLQEVCDRLVGDPGVREAIRELYDPGARFGRDPGPDSAEDEAARSGWDAIDFDTLSFHRCGTTSMILECRSNARSRGRTHRLALKCLLFPHLRVNAIAAATREYHERYRIDDADSSPLVEVWASHDSWILMEFIRGRTLAEYLRDTAPDRPAPKREILRPIDIGRMEALGPPLFEALAEMEAAGRHHHDLSPSNIIVQTRSAGAGVRVRLIDLGVNYLHTRTLTGPSSGDYAYVAPEVRKAGAGGDRADLYSLGVLLIAIGGIPRREGELVPDQFYAASVGLARLLEDLLDSDPDRRLLVSGLDRDRGRFEQLSVQYRNEIEVLRASRPVRPDGRPEGALARLRAVSPGGGAVARQRHVWEIRRHQARHGEGSEHARRARYLKRWALLAAVLSWATMAIVLTWWARDLGVEWQAKWLEVVNNALRRSPDQGLLLLDDIRAADYPIPDGWDNLPVRIAAVTYALPGAKLYFNIFADMTPFSTKRRRGMAWVRTAAAAFMIRAVVFFPWIYILLPTLVQRRWWPLFCALGVITVSVLITACLWFARDANRRAREAGLSTVPDGEITSLERLAGWQLSAWLYCVPVTVVGILLYFDRLHDELVYASAIGVINIGIWYVKNCTIDAPNVKTGMVRAILAAERLDHLAAKRVTVPAQAVPKPEPVATG